MPLSIGIRSTHITNIATSVDIRRIRNNDKRTCTVQPTVDGLSFCSSSPSIVNTKRLRGAFIEGHLIEIIMLSIVASARDRGFPEAFF